MLAIALVTAIVAGALFLPVMAGNDECRITCGHCAEEYGYNTLLYWVCHILRGDCSNPCSVPGPDPGMPIQSHRWEMELCILQINQPGKKLPAKIAFALIIATIAVAVVMPVLAGGGLDSCEKECGAYTKCMAYESGSRDEYWCYEGQHFCWELTQACSLFW